MSSQVLRREFFTHMTLERPGSGPRLQAASVSQRSWTDADQLWMVPGPHRHGNNAGHQGFPAGLRTPQSVDETG